MASTVMGSCLQAWRSTPSVDVELVSLGVRHGHRVVVDSFFVERLHPGSAQSRETGGLRFDTFLSDLKWHGAVPAHPYVEVEPILDRLELIYELKPDLRAAPSGVAEAVRTNPEFLFRDSGIPPIIVPVPEPVGRRCHYISEGGSPEFAHSGRVLAIDHYLEPYRHGSSRARSLTVQAADKAREMGATPTTKSEGI